MNPEGVSVKQCVFWSIDIATYTDPKAVPRIVWGLKNLQQASLNAEILFTRGSGPAAPTWVQAWQHPLYNINGMDTYSLRRILNYWNMSV